ncbi:MAG: redox-regulated ATPase YchF [Chlamydiales bacterium]|nr:redox-regulated ATPase YchF [Chlamydiales bacterium]
MSGLSCGIVGLPNVGKSTLFNALTRNQIPASNFPFCTIDPNVGIVELDDPRLRELSKLSGSHKIVYAPVTFVDIAGLVKGASKGEGLGNKFLSNIRETDLIVHVVRCFADDNIIHVEGKIDPISDIEVINLELILADLQMIENSMAKLEKQARSSKEFKPVLDTMKKVSDHLNQNQPVRSISLTLEEQEHIKPYNFITQKPVIYLTNVAEEDIPLMENEYVKRVREHAQKEKAQVIPICAKFEEELSALSDEERLQFLQSVGLQEPGLTRLIRSSFYTLGLITFLTTGEIETRAWTIHKGLPAPEAAGKIHSDIQKGFIRAEVISYEDYTKYKTRAAAKEAGKARSEGKDYIVQDGDVILFYHNK